MTGGVISMVLLETRETRIGSGSAEAVPISLVETLVKSIRALHELAHFSLPWWSCRWLWRTGNQAPEITASGLKDFGGEFRTCCGQAIAPQDWD